VSDVGRSSGENPQGYADLPELLRHLDRDGGTAAVVVALKAPDAHPVPPPEETERLAKKLIDDAEKATGSHPSNSNVFRRFGRFVLEAPAEIIRYIAAQPEVEDVTPNEKRDLELISPVRSKPVRE
jgi:hypothetical protein